MQARLSSPTLVWRVFGTNAAVLVLALLGLVFAPVTVSVPPHLSELIVLAVGLAAMLALNLSLLRATFRPLDKLAETMRRHDSQAPAPRTRVDGAPDVAALATAYGDMLDRLVLERRDSGRRALMVQEHERRRIARDMHDEVGQTLTGVMLQLEGLAAVFPDELREQLNELRETAREGIEEVRSIARRLRPEALEDLGLQSALTALAIRSAEQSHLHISRQLDTRLTLSREQELVVYRVAEEALTNVAQHAQAAHVELRLDRTEGQAVLIVRDDGRGLGRNGPRSTQGIRRMHERATLIGARLTIGPAQERGTEVRLSIPLELQGTPRSA